jgi:hypothetical protein
MHTAEYCFVNNQFSMVVISAGPGKSCQSLNE